jgi:predicted alpha/beta superfamily hydrolase
MRSKTAGLILLTLWLPVCRAQTAACEVTGALELRTFSSRVFHNTRYLRVWLPPHYREAQNRRRRYPVLYLNDGQDIFNACTSIFNRQEWHADETATELIRAGKIPQLIIVGVDNAGKRDRPREYLPYPDDTLQPSVPIVDGKRYPEFLFDEVIPFIDREYRTNRDPASVYLGGSSYGAGVALYAAMTRPGSLAGLLLESPSLYADHDHLLHDAERCSSWPQRIYIGVGTVQEPQEDVERLRAILSQHGLGPYRLLMIVTEGAGHNEDAWAARLPRAITFLLGSNSSDQ